MTSYTRTNKRISTIAITVFIFLLCLAFDTEATIINVTAINQVGDVDNVVNGNCSFYEAARAASRNEAIDACPAGQPSEEAKDIIVLPANMLFSVDENSSSYYINLWDDVLIQGNGSVLERAPSATDKFSLIIIIDETVEIEHLTIRGGDSTGSGGCIQSSVNTAAKLIIRDSIISGCSAKNGGGLAGRSLDIIRTQIIDNTATDGRGGGVYLLFSTAKLTLTDSTISANSASLDGGGIGTVENTNVNYSPSIQIQGAIISHNTAGISGGGIYQSSSYGVNHIIDSQIFNNTAYVTGGAIYANTRLIQHIKRSAIYNNVTTLSANAGIAYDDTDGGLLAITNTTISGNRSTAALDKSVHQLTLTHMTGLWIYESTILSDGDAIFAGFAGNDNEGAPGLVIQNSVVSSCSLNSLLPPAFTDITDSWFITDSCNNVANGDPMLSPLVELDGPTVGHVPLAGSPLIDQSDNTPAAPYYFIIDPLDQRGFTRPLTGRDIGSIEVEGTDPKSASFFVIPLPNGKVIVFDL